MTILTKKLEEEHQEIYEKLAFFMEQISSVKNKRNDEFLIKQVSELIDFVRQLLNEHFKVEEQELFPQLAKESPHLEYSIEVCKREHQTIKEKFDNLEKLLIEFKQDQNIDYKENLLFPSYNLIATINHHALREDRELF